MLAHCVITQINVKSHTKLPANMAQCILSRASEVGSPTNHPGLWAATRHGVRDPLVC